MKRPIILCIIFFILCPLALGQHEYTSKSMEISFNITRDFEIVRENPEIVVDYIHANLYLTPNNTTNQKIMNLKTHPDADNKNNKSIFSWQRPAKNKLSYSVEALLHNKYYLPKVKKVSADHQKEKYLEPNEINDYNTSSLQKAKEQINITTDNPYKIAHKYAVWVNKNIEYKNNKITSAQKKSSWALKTKTGNCDEFANVFISLCRSSGIPARLVSGVAYSGSGDSSAWNKHGWAEVYFGEYGWVPFDVTFGEFGYLNPAHIKLMSKTETNKANTVYETNTTNIVIKTTKNSINTSIQNIGERVESPLHMNARWIKNNTCFNSYNALQVSVKNPKDYYVPSKINIRLPPGLEKIKGRSYLLMPPKSKKDIYFIAKGNESKENNYLQHTTIYTPRNYEVNSTFTADKAYPCYSLTKIKKLINNEDKNLNLSCKSDKRTYLVGETANIKCSVLNKGKKKIQDKLCSDKCNNFVLEPGEKKLVNFSKKITETGKSTLNLSIQEQEELVSFIAYKRPGLKIVNISAPANITFDKEFSINFTLSKENLANINNCSVKIINDDINHDWQVDKIQNQRHFVLHIDNFMLSSPKNEFKIETQYSGSLGREFNDSQPFTIKVEDLSLWERLLMLGNSIMHSIKYKFWEVSLVIILSSMLTAIIFQILDVEGNRKKSRK